MADPFSLASIGMGAGILGGGASAVGASLSSSAQQQNYLFQGHVAELNAQIARQNAAQALNTGEGQAGIAGAKTREQLGQIRAGQGASGLDANSGSASAVQRSADLVGIQNQGVIRSNAAQRAFGFETSAYSSDLQASADRSASKSAAAAGNIGILSSILGSASSVSSKYLQGTQMGTFGGGGTGSNVGLFSPGYSVG